MKLHWMYSEEARQINDKDPAEFSFRMSREFLGTARHYDAAGDAVEAARVRRVSDGYLDDAVSKRKSKRS